ncbi:MAG: DUF1353 domain-containing protein [Acidobacteriia bacterium]|nr:DUF1353 domain-containing protein [Terriglobia bacterium]
MRKAFFLLLFLAAAPISTIGTQALAESAIAAPVEDFGKFLGNPQTEWNQDGRTMRLIKTFVYEDANGKDWTAPANSTIDGASIPRIFWSIIGGPFEGEYRNASIVHDTECQSHTHPWQDVHRMFYSASRAGGASEFKAKIMFAAVYHFGPRWPKPGETQAPPTSLQSEDDMLRTIALIRKNRDISIDAIQGLSHLGLATQVSDEDLASERRMMQEIQRQRLSGEPLVRFFYQ